MLEGALEARHDEPGVEGEALADRLGSDDGAVGAVGDRPDDAGVEGERAQVRQRVLAAAGPLVADEAGVHRHDLGDRVEDREHRGVAGGARAGRVVVDEVVRDPQQAGGGLGALGVAAHPVQVGGDTGCGGRVAGGGPPFDRGEGEALPLGGGRLGVGADPHVLAHRAGDARDGAGVGADGEPAEAAGHDDVVLLVGDGEGAQHDAARLEAAGGDHGCRRHRQRVLRGPAPRLGLDAHGELVALVGAQLPAEDRVAVAAARGRLDDEAGEVGDDVAEVGGLAGPPRLGRGEGEVLAEDVPADLRQVGDERRVFEHPGGDRVDDRDVAEAGGLDDAGQAEAGVAAQVELVDGIALDAAHDDVDRGEPARRAHPDAAVATDEVLGLDDGHAEHGGLQRLVEGRVAQGAGREDDDAGHVVGVGGGGDERLVHVEEEPAQPGEVDLAVQVGQDARDDPAVGHGVAGAGRCLGAVGEDPPGAVAVAGEVHRRHDELAGPGQVDAVGLREPAVVPVDGGTGQDPGAHKALLAGEVGEHGVEQGGALAHALLEAGPLGGAEGERQRVELPLARLGGDLAPFGCLAVLGGDAGAVGDAVVGDEAPGRRARCEEGGQTGAGDLVGERLRRLTHPVEGDELVDPFAARDDLAVVVEQG